MIYMNCVGGGGGGGGGQAAGANASGKCYRMEEGNRAEGKRLPRLHLCGAESAVENTSHIHSLPVGVHHE